ncbi:hypothetical protein ABZY09_35110 [Streptomyces sp. NPDC002928]|uniref:hypothetical protein n=1 Tax=Streptomyces sp. NPDC002928 TaxID=3154440 RepID=UPI0033AD2761
MRDAFTTSAGKLAFGFFVGAISMFVAAFVWGFSTESDRQFDLAIGVMRAGEVIAAIGLLFAIRHRAVIRARRNDEGRG